MIGPTRGNPPLPNIDAEVVYSKDQGELMVGFVDVRGLGVGLSCSSWVNRF